MKTLTELEPEVMQLPDSERARLATQLLGSLPAVLAEDDDGVAEALRRDAELNLDARNGMALDNLAVVAERRDEPVIPHMQLVTELKRDGVLRAGNASLR